jgi:hypothetical protein
LLIAYFQRISITVSNGQSSITIYNLQSLELPMTKQLPKPLTTILAGTLFLSVVLGCGLTGKLFDKKSMFEGTTAQDAGEAFKKKLGW